MSWIDFRTELFRTMEERRAKVACFQFEQHFMFVVRCSHLFNKPGTKEATDALAKIQNDGTFFMVADSLSELLMLFPSAEMQLDSARR